MSDDFDKSLKLTKQSLLISGIKVSRNPMNTAVEYFINHYLYYCNVIILYSVLYGETYWIVNGVKTGIPFVELSLTSPCLTISVLGTVKSLFLYLNREILIQVVDKLKEIHPAFDDVEETETECKIVAESKTLLKAVQVLLMSIYIIVFMTFCFVPVLLSGYNYYYKTGEFEVAYPYFVKYPFDVYKTSFWPLIYILQLWAKITPDPIHFSAAIVVFFVFGSDTLFFALCVFIKMHFRLLGRQYENIVSTSKTETQTNLANAVVRHQELINLVNQAEVLYSKSSLFNIITSSVLICLSAFNITVADQMNIIVAFITFLMMSLSQISLLCFFADLLMNSSTEISGSVYRCSWYEADENSKKTLLLVMMRSQKACRLTAWKFVDLNLEAFTTILSRSWSYFALLKTVYK